MENADSKPTGSRVVYNPGDPAVNIEESRAYAVSPSQIHRHPFPVGGGNFMIAVHPIIRWVRFVGSLELPHVSTFPLGFASPIRCHYTPHKTARHRSERFAIRNSKLLTAVFGVAAAFIEQLVFSLIITFNLPSLYFVDHKYACMVITIIQMNDFLSPSQRVLSAFFCQQRCKHSNLYFYNLNVCLLSFRTYAVHIYISFLFQAITCFLNNSRMIDKSVSVMFMLIFCMT